MKQLLNEDIMSFANEIIELPKELVKISGTDNAYRDWKYDVVRTTYLTYYNFEKPPLKYIIKFFELYRKSLNQKFNLNEDIILNEIKQAKERFQNGEDIHLKKKIIRAIGENDTTYQIRYFPYGEAALGHVLLVMVEEQAYGYDNNVDYNYIDEGDNGIEDFFDDDQDF